MAWVHTQMSQATPANVLCNGAARLRFRFRSVPRQATGADKNDVGCTVLHSLFGTADLLGRSER